MNDSLLVPLGKAIATKIRDVKTPGLMLPMREHDETLMLVSWENAMHGVMLTGPQAFIFFRVLPQSPHSGLFIPEPDILVDMSSAASAVGRDEDEGVLFLSQGLLSVIGKGAGNAFSYPQPIPLWTEVHGGSEATKVAFTRWGIGIPKGDNHRVLWQHEFKARAR